MRRRAIVVACGGAAVVISLFSAGIVVGYVLADGGSGEAESVTQSRVTSTSTPRNPRVSSSSSIPSPSPSAAAPAPALDQADSPAVGSAPPPAIPPPATPTPAPAAAPPVVAQVTPETAVLSADCPACGEPRNFCDTWAGGVCNDYRQLGATSFEVAFPPPSEEVTFDCFSSTAPEYFPTMNAQNAAEGFGTPLPYPCAFSKYEHFMTRMEDGNFGMAVLRFHRPFDFTARTGHLRFDVDLKTSARRYVRVMLSPELTKALTDDRQAQDRRPGTALDIWYRDGHFTVTTTRGGSITTDTVSSASYFGMDDVRDTVDVYVSRGSVRLDINGQTQFSQPIADLGFEQAYVYLSQVSYNPCKDNECSEREQIFHWDNVAFDGPRHTTNALTPAGFRDVIFNVFRATSCTLGGLGAAPVGADPTGSWTTFRVRMPDDGTPVDASQIGCSREVEREGWNAVQGLEVVRPGG
jgi:hypothetical protein